MEQFNKKANLKKAEIVAKEIHFEASKRRSFSITEISVKNKNWHTCNTD